MNTIRTEDLWLLDIPRMFDKLGIVEQGFLLPGIFYYNISFHYVESDGC